MENNYVLVSSDENIEKTLCNNTLNNNEWLINFINKTFYMDEAIIAIDGQWGSGKTFLAKQLCKIINEKFMMEKNQNKEEIDFKYPSISFKNLNINSCYAIYYNAWNYDNDNNPMASFLYFLLKTLNKNIHSNSFVNVSKNLIKNVLEKMSNGWIKIDSSGESDLEKVLDSVLTSEYINEQISCLIDELKAENFNKLFIVIDELDRCRPTYALQFLEMMEHFLKRKDILIICMTDLNQLNNIIKTNYGNANNTILYFDKIFDLRIEMPKNYDLSLYISNKIGDFNDSYFLENIIKGLINEFNLSLRNVDRFLLYLKPFLESAKKNRKSRNPIYDSEANYFIKNLFAPYYICTKLFDINEYNNFIFGDLSKFMNFIKKNYIYERVESLYSNNQGKDKQIAEYIKEDILTLIKCVNNEIDYVDKLNAGRAYFSIKDYCKELSLFSCLNIF